MVFCGENYAHKKWEVYASYPCIIEIAFFKSSKFITGCISTLASNPWNNGSAIAGIISGLGKSNTSTMVLFPFTSVKYAASRLNFLHRDFPHGWQNITNFSGK